ncbi:MAG TPA: carbohydrate-binding protein [Polyangia bacterium]|nr:carbohydrate-binding protein [Polyangia bacterium]
MRTFHHVRAGLAIGALSLCQCTGSGPSGNGAVTTTTEAVGQPSADEVGLDGNTVPKFAQQLPIPMIWTGTPVVQNGKTVQVNYNLSVVQTTEQQLPPGFPASTVLAYNGSAHVKGSSSSSTITVTPGAVFENTVGIPSQITWVDNIQQPAFLEVDPTLHWANPLAEAVPTPPFNFFPPGYANSLFPVAHVTHTHGLVVAPNQDGTAEEWFTPGLQYKGPSFATNVYFQPNQQSPTQLFYHDHVMGVTRIGLYSGVVGTADFLRDPAHTPLDAPSSPLPTGQFEIPLALSARAYYTDGNLDFPPDRGTLNSADAEDLNGGDAPSTSPYWSYNEGADEITVNGAVWPNLNVNRQQYRFRMLAGANAQLFDLQLCQGDWNAHNSPDGSSNSLVTISADGNSATCTSNLVPFQVIGSDGGYLPAPQTVTDVQIGITERADILVDFSKFAPGTKILMMNQTAHAGHETGTTEVVMQFTVQNTTPITPPTLNPSLFPAKPTLTPNAPTRHMVLFSNVDDDPLAPTFDKRAIQGTGFDSPPTEFALIGSTEEWDLINSFPANADLAGDSDLNTHQIHIHLLEFQALNRQAFDCGDYVEKWTLLNGKTPTSSAIFLDPTPYLQGNPIVQPAPVETGWKDTIQAPSCTITRILVRWAPQETVAGGVQPGQNQYPIDPTSFPTDPIAGPGYVWHCHLVGHEDHDMMRELVVVNAWVANHAYKVGTVVTFNNADYRVTTAHTSTSATPDTLFNLWDKVNNEKSTNGGHWTPQVRYAVLDRVLDSNGNLFQARSVFQAQNGQTPANNPSLWTALPNTACGQLAQFCQGNSMPFAQQCLAAGQAGNESACLGFLDSGPRGTPNVGMNECMSDCLATALPTPCSGLCNNPVVFSVAPNGNFQSGNLGTGATCFETQSRLQGGESTNLVAPRQMTVNGRVEPQTGNWTYPLPPMRHNGYCIQTTAGNQSFAAFSAFAGPQ